MADKRGSKKFEEIKPEDKQKALEAAIAQIEKQNECRSYSYRLFKS